MYNSPSVSKTKPLSIIPNFIPQRVHMNVVQLEAMRFKEFTPSSRRPRLMSGIPHIPIIVSHKQQIRSIMPQTTIVTCKLGQKAKPSRRSQVGEWSNYIPSISEYSSWKMS